MIDNPIQKITGPCVILAGAGTGKTYTIVEKIKYFIENKTYKPERIVCITFSNEAANNLILRTDKTLENEEKNKPIIRTFHGFSADLLRIYGDKIGISKEFKILDTDQAKVILHRNLKINPVNCHKYISTIGTAKDLGIKLEEFEQFLNAKLLTYENMDMEKKLENMNFELQTLHLSKNKTDKKILVNEIKKLRRIIELRKFVNAWRAYEKLKSKGNYQDYSDLNKNALCLLEKNPEISNDFDYVIVDEFQDTNKLQLDFLIKLASHNNITVVGDMNQSIYRFRGAYKENLNLFKQAFDVKQGDIFNLSKSHRSPNKVLKTAHKLILNNYQNPAECFFVDNIYNREGNKVEVYELSNAREEARKVIEIIREETKNGCPIEEICVMFRTHQQGRIIKRFLEQEKIPYYAVSKSSLLKQKSVKTIHSYLSIINKLKNKEKGGEDSWWGLIYNSNFSKDDLIKIGKEIKNFSKRHNGNERESIGSQNKENQSKSNSDNSSSYPNHPMPYLSTYLLESLEKLQLSGEGNLGVKIIIEKIKKMMEFSQKGISELVKEACRISGFINEQRTKEEKEIMLNLNKFYEIAKMHEDFYDSDLSNFLYYLETLETLEIEIEASRIEEPGVRLMTSHATKGLEYNKVIITNLAHGRFPIEKYASTNLIPTELLPEVKNEIAGLDDEQKDNFILYYEKYNQLLEERRLAYVSFTRAKENLFLTYAREYAGKKLLPSQFLNEISYKNNPDIAFIIDLETKYSEPKAEIKPAYGLHQFLDAKTLETIELNQPNELNKEKEEHKRFSPSALLLFDECQKQFEYKYVFNMPERKAVSWEAMRLGSFVHIVLEQGVKQAFKKIDDFLALAKEMSMDEDWESINLNEAETLLRVFFERNKGKYNEESETEQYLNLNLSGMNFIGFADRIDFDEGGSASIIDYKTGKSTIAVKDRNWQLGFYALAAKEKYNSVKCVVLDMLKQDKPIEFDIDEQGNAICKSSDRIDGFNIYDVRSELIETGKAILQAYKQGFKPCSPEKNCDFCNEFVWKI